MDWSPDRALTRRMALALLLTLLGYVVLLGPVFWYLPLPTALAVTAVVVGFVAVLATQADRLLYLVTQPVAIDGEDYPQLVETVDRLANQAGVSSPAIAVIPGYEPNALSAGIGDRAVVCVTVGLLNELDDDELEAVLAHELAHLENGDSAVMTVAGFPATVGLALLGVAVEYFDGWAYLLGYVLVLLLLAAVGVPLLVASLPGTLALSRYREYAADRGAVAMTGDPAALARALERLDGESDAPDTDLRRIAGFSAFCIVPVDYAPVPLPSTHPPTRERVRRLRDLATDLETTRASGSPQPS